MTPRAGQALELLAASEAAGAAEAAQRAAEGVVAEWAVRGDAAVCARDAAALRAIVGRTVGVLAASGAFGAAAPPRGAGAGRAKASRLPSPVRADELKVEALPKVDALPVRPGKDPYGFVQALPLLPAPAARPRDLAR